MSQVVWRRDFIKFPASRSQGCRQGRAGLTTLWGGAVRAVSGIDCVHRNVAGGKGPIWGLMADDGWKEGRSPETLLLGLDQFPKTQRQGKEGHRCTEFPAEQCAPGG